jgi:NDP-sugar pyrophosphorylase family protein
MILAAGFGTRLGTLSDERPKPLLPVADVPLVRWALALLRGAGIAEVVVNLHHHADAIAAELGDEVRTSREANILGTGGGIRRALPLLDDGGPFVVANGKIVTDIDVAAVLAAHRAAGAAATLVVRADADARRWGAIDAPEDGGPIRSLLGDGAFMFTGVHVLDPALVARLPDDGVDRCIVRQGYVPWLAEGVPIHAYIHRGYFMEHSTPERYLAGNINVVRGAVGPGHDGVDPTARVHATARIEPPVRVGPGADIGARAQIGPDAVVGSGARVAEGVRVARAVIWSGAEVDSDAVSAIVTPRQRVSVTL